MHTLVGQPAPAFITSAVIDGVIQEDFSLISLHGSPVILFFYPLDFTFVCPTELHAFQERLEDFKQRGAHLIGCSIDSCFSHLAWLKTPRSEGGIEGISYPLLSDVNKRICMDYGVLNHDSGIAYRALFLIDKQGVIRHNLVNDLPLGRSVDEVLRMLDALVFHEKHGEVCPANWNAGKKAMKATSEGLTEYFKPVKA